MNDKQIAIQVVESLRKGVPPQRGVDMYAVGNDKFMDNISRFHFSGISERGIIRFVSGSWGAGKTHFFRLLRETAFKNNCMVSNVELNKSEGLDKFERVFYSILRRVATRYCYAENGFDEAAPFGIVLREALAFLGRGGRVSLGMVTQDQFQLELAEYRAAFNRGEVSLSTVTHDQFQQAETALMADRGIDIDFKKIVVEFWRTFLPDAVEPAMQEQIRAELLQWFEGEGTVGSYRKRFGVNKIVNKDNAKLMLQSLAGFVRLSGYAGLVILFDEAEMSFSAMRNTQLNDAHNNLLSLINNIESLAGLFLIYATVPDFYTDPKHGIVRYGALAGRIGKPEDHSPRALEIVWNLDRIESGLPEYQAAANKIKGIYGLAYDMPELPSDTLIQTRVMELYNMHPSRAPVRFWRVLVEAIVKYLNDYMEGDIRTTEQLHDDIMDSLKEQ